MSSIFFQDLEYNFIYFFCKINKLVQLKNKTLILYVLKYTVYIYCNENLTLFLII